MTFTVSAGPLAALIAGILILIIPRLLNYIIALYLIVIGVLGLSGHARADMSAYVDHAARVVAQSSAVRRDAGFVKGPPTAVPSRPASDATRAAAAPRA